MTGPETGVQAPFLSGNWHPNFTIIPNFNQHPVFTEFLMRDCTERESNEQITKTKANPVTRIKTYFPTKQQRPGFPRRSVSSLNHVQVKNIPNQSKLSDRPPKNKRITHQMAKCTNRPAEFAPISKPRPSHYPTSPVPSTNNHEQGGYSVAAKIITCPRLTHPDATTMRCGDLVHVIINEVDLPIQNWYLGDRYRLIPPIFNQNTRLSSMACLAHWSASSLRTLLMWEEEILEKDLASYFIWVMMIFNFLPYRRDLPSIALITIIKSPRIERTLSPLPRVRLRIRTYAFARLFEAWPSPQAKDKTVVPLGSWRLSLLLPPLEK